MLSILLKIIQETGDYIAERSALSFAVSEKEGRNNLVTEVDTEAERRIKTAILNAYPDHGFIGEEYGIENPKARYQWIIDPIDGTVNFAHHIPLYCVSIALAIDGILTYGAIYNPVLKELFYAEKGKGAFLNHQPIRVSKQEDFSRSFLVTGFPYHLPEGLPVTEIFSAFIHKGLPVRRLGSAALDLAYVACGRFDAFWEFNLNAWDIAAGYLIVEEAGGKISDFSGNPGHYYDSQTLASNGLLHEELRKTITEYI
ncbi:MAG: inositol monophosphatase [Taibaiella sp.]|nr:inositol monophosphatase [Taibaiella sp.]